MGRSIFYLAAMGTGFLLFLAMADSRLGFLGLVAFLPLFWMLDNIDNPRLAFLHGWAGGSFFFLLFLHWLAIPVWNFGGAFRHLGIFGLLILFLIMGLFWGAFSYLLTQIRQTFPVSFVFAAPLLWVLLEFLRLHILSPLPLGMAGYALAPYPQLIQSAGIFGVLGISFFVLLVNSCLWAFSRGKESRISAAIILILVMGANLGYGYWSMQKNQEEMLEVGLVQGNISQEEKWDYRLREANLEAHLEPSRELAPEVDLVVWPETSIPTTPLGSQAQWGTMKDFFNDLEVPLLAGILSPDNNRVYNTALLLKGGEIQGSYNKKWLVPFGEYIPLQGLLGWVDTGFVPTTPGEEIKIFEHGDWTWATPICYEVLNSGLIRRMSSEADILFHQSNEAWFENSIGLPVLWSVNLIRAVEVNRPIVKVANTGYTGWVDELGQTRSLFPHLEHHYGRVTVTGSGQDTIYMRYGDLMLLPIFVGGSALSFLVGPRRKKRIDFKKYAGR